MQPISYQQARTGVLREHFLLFKLHARWTSPPLVWLLSRAGWSANAVSCLAMGLALPAAICNWQGHFYWGILVFHLFFVLDSADGTLARATGTTSIAGAYLDDLGHYLFDLLFFISLGLGLQRHGHPLAGILALSAVLANTVLRAQRDLFKVQCPPAPRASPGVASPLDRFKTWLLGSFDFPNILVVMTLTAWRLAWMDAYFLYCIVMASAYIVYTARRQARSLASLSPAATPLAR